MSYLRRYGRISVYDRKAAVAYAHRWALGRNPQYYDFEENGGDCTNFASQVIHAGSKIMNYTPVFGWYYIDSYRRTPSWTGVEYLYRFMTNNSGTGPYAVETDVRDIMPGDIVQISFVSDQFTHTPVVVSVGTPVAVDNILIAAHSYDRDNYPLAEYDWKALRFLHILGSRV